MDTPEETIPEMIERLGRERAEYMVKLFHETILNPDWPDHPCDAPAGLAAYVEGRLTT